MNPTEQRIRELVPRIGTHVTCDLEAVLQAIRQGSTGATLRWELYIGGGMLELKNVANSEKFFWIIDKAFSEQPQETQVFIDKLLK